MIVRVYQTKKYFIYFDTPDGYLMRIFLLFAVKWVNFYTAFDVISTRPCTMCIIQRIIN